MRFAKIAPFLLTLAFAALPVSPRLETPGADAPSAVSSRKETLPVPAVHASEGKAAKRIAHSGFGSAAPSAIALYRAPRFSPDAFGDRSDRCVAVPHLRPRARAPPARAVSV